VYDLKFLSIVGDLENENLSTAVKYFVNFLSEMTNDEVEYIMKFYANPYKKKLHE
jgi:tRNA G46 methylase TrmB